MFGYDADAYLPWIGIASIAIVWLGLLYLIHKWSGNKSMSFSMHAAQSTAARMYYFVLFIIILPMFYAFAVGWLEPQLELGQVFTILITVGVLGQLLAATVPARGRQEKIHNIGAYAMALSMIPLTVLIAISSAGLLVSVIAWVAVAYMITATILFVKFPKTHESYLYYQAAYIAAFHVVVLLATLNILFLAH